MPAICRNEDVAGSSQDLPLGYARPLLVGKHRFVRRITRLRFPWSIPNASPVRQAGQEEYKEVTIGIGFVARVYEGAVYLTSLSWPKSLQT